MRATLGAIQQAEREEIRRQALREAAELMAHLNEDEDVGHPEMIVKLRRYGRRERSDAILALIGAPPAAAPERPEVVALAKLFEWFWEQEGVLNSSEWEDGICRLAVRRQPLRSHAIRRVGSRPGPHPKAGG